jgi:hypothetical protein
MTEQDDQYIITATLNDDYDSPWKKAIERYLPEFMAFYFSDAYAQINWSKEYIFLDQELQAVMQDAELGKRFVDKLVRVSLRNGNEHWVYIHIEVQGSRQAQFPERIFIYNYRLYDRYRRPIASMAVLADEHPQWKPTSFGFDVLGFKLAIEFPVAKLTDYRDKVDELLASTNVFALITAAHILTRQTRKKDQERYEAKLRLVRILYSLDWDKQRVIDLFTVVDWMMKLPKWLDKQVWHEIETIEEVKKMEYVTSVERMGIAQGRVEGRVEGLLEGESKLLKRLLERRFGTLPSWASDKINSAVEQDFECWCDAVLTAPTLEAVFNKDTTH